MRLALSSSLMVLQCALGSAALGACADDGPAGSGAFKSPYGDPDSSVVCGTDSYLRGYICVSRTSLLDAAATPGDAALAPDAEVDGQAPRTLAAWGLAAWGSAAPELSPGSRAR